MPAASDTSISAEILRIKMLRNEVYGHISSAQLDDTKFETLWQEISKPLVKLGIPQQEIDELQEAPLCPEEESYIKNLEEWKEEEDDLLSRFSDLEAAFAQLRNVVENVNLSQTDKLAKFDFTGKIKNLCKKFQDGTRQWFFDKLSSWFRDEESSVMILTAGPGVGKSVLSAKVCELYQKTGQLAANHFCDFRIGDCRDPHKILQSLASQMCDNVDGFHDELTEALSREHSRHSLQDAFRVLLNDPLHALDRTEPMLIVVDALDETKTANKSDILNLISSEFSQLPKWIKIVVTSRPELEVRKKLEHLNPLEIRPDDNQHELDLEHFIRCSLDFNISYYHNIIRSLMSKCEGSFLYAYYLVNDIKQKGLGIEPDVNNYNPKGISGFYEQQFERLKTDLQQYKQIAEVSIFKIFVNVIAASETPLPFSILLKCMGLPNLEFEIREKIIGLMSEILPVYDDCLTVFHKSLWDWLKLDGYKEHAYAADVADGEKRLWGACKKVYTEIDSLCSVADFQISCQEMYVLTNGSKYLMNVEDTGNFHWLVNVKVNFLKLKFCNIRNKLENRSLGHSTRHFDFFDILQNYGSELQKHLYWLLSQHIAFCTNMNWLLGNGKLDRRKECYIYLEDVANGRIGFLENSVAFQITAKDILNETNRMWLEEATHKSSSTFKITSYATFGHNGNICSMMSSPNNKLLVSIHKKRVEVLEIPSLTIVFRLLLNREVCDAQLIVFSPDSSYFLTNSLRTCVSIKEQKEVSFILHGPAEICCCSFSSCGTKIVTFEKESVKLWDVRNKVLLVKKYHGCSMKMRKIAFFSNCNSYIFLYDKVLQTIEMVFDSTTLKEIASDDFTVYTHFANNDCIRIISRSGYENSGIINDIRFGKCYQLLTGENILFPNVYCSETFPWKGRKCVVSCNSSYGALSLLVCDVVKQEVVDTFEISCLSAYNCVNYISNLTETNFLVCLNCNSAVVISLQGTSESFVSPLFPDDMQELVPLFCALSPENCYIACNYASRILKIMSVTNGETLQTILLKRKPIACWWSELYLWVIFTGPEVVKYPYHSTHTKILETEFEDCFFNCKGHVLKFAEGLLVVSLDDSRVSISKIGANSFFPPKIFDCAFATMAAISSDGRAILVYGASKYMLWETECEDKWELILTGSFRGSVDGIIVYGCLFGTKASRRFSYLAHQGWLGWGYNFLHSVDFSNGRPGAVRQHSEHSIVCFGRHIYLDPNFLVFYDDLEIHFYCAPDAKLITSIFVGTIDFFFFFPAQQVLLLFSGYDIKHFKIHNLVNYLSVPLEKH